MPRLVPRRRIKKKKNGKGAMHRFFRVINRGIPRKLAQRKKAEGKARESR